MPFSYNVPHNHLMSLKIPGKNALKGTKINDIHITFAALLFWHYMAVKIDYISL